MYSQHEEEAIIAQHVPNVGRFLDIGAFEPCALSNTRALYEHGWSGVCVEPSPGPARKLIAEYGAGDRVQVVCAAAVTHGTGLITLHATDDAVTTDSEEVRELWAEAGGYYGKFLAGTVTLGELLRMGPYDFIDIDTEGSSVDLLRALLDSGARPACICVEHDNRAAEIEAAIKGKYRPEWGNGTNLILVAR